MIHCWQQGVNRKLFIVQVNQWLTWLETAEEEESEEEDYWGTGQSHVFITMQWTTFCFLFFLSCVRALMCPPSPLTPSPSPTSLVYIQYIYFSTTVTIQFAKTWIAKSSQHHLHQRIYAFIDYFKILFDVLYEMLNHISCFLEQQAVLCRKPCHHQDLTHFYHLDI